MHAVSHTTVQRVCECALYCRYFHEAIAILAGDALLTLSFEVMLAQKDVQPQTLVAVVAEIAKAAGPSGMVGGQVLDMQSEGQNIPLEKLQLMHNAKTGAQTGSGFDRRGKGVSARPVNCQTKCNRN